MFRDASNGATVALLGGALRGLGLLRRRFRPYLHPQFLGDAKGPEQSEPLVLPVRRGERQAVNRAVGAPGAQGSFSGLAPGGRDYAQFLVADPEDRVGGPAMAVHPAVSGREVQSIV